MTEEISHDVRADLRAHLSELVEAPEALDALDAAASFSRVRAGDVLFEHGDQADAVHVILSGRLVAELPEADGGARVDMGRGQVVGEIAVVGDLARTATVRAARPSLVARIGADDLLQVAGTHPPLLRSLVRTALRRGSNRRETSAKAHTLAVLVTAPVDRRVTVTRITDELEHHATTTTVRSVSIDRAVGVEGSVLEPIGSPTDLAVTSHLSDLEVANDIVVFDTDGDIGWSERVVRHADRLVAIVSPDPGVEECTGLESVLAAARAGHTPVTAVVVHGADCERPTGADWYHGHDGVDEVLHIRDRRKSDLERVARLASGNGVGVALGGGGARGFAHLGVMKALRERDIPIDRVCGASIGSVMATLPAQDVPEERWTGHVTEQFDGLLDYTIPVVSLVKGQAITSAVEANMGEWRIEDTWIPYACVSTNLTRSVREIHRSGELGTAVRASVAIPGVLPPVPFRDDLLVDGGVLDNLPAGLLADDPSIGTVIAVDVAPPRGPGAKNDFGLSVSGWQALTAKFRPGSTKYPGITAVLLRSMLVGAVKNQQELIESGAIDLLIRLPLRGVGLLEFDRVADVSAVGHELAAPILDAWLRGERIEVDGPDGPTYTG